MSGIKLTSDTLIGTPAGGNIEYNGQFFGTDSNNSRAQLERHVLETAKSASGTAVDFTGIPSWVKRITVMFDGVSTNGTSLFQIQIGDSGGIETTGYLGGCAYATNIGVNSSAFLMEYSGGPTAAVARYGVVTLANITGNTWCLNGVISWSTTGTTVSVAGSKSLSATLDRIRITTVNGTDTFDAGTINILYEG